MKDQSLTTGTLALPNSTSVISKPIQIAAAALLGGVLLFGVGFANSATLHTATHDVRHAAAFPCH